MGPVRKTGIIVTVVGVLILGVVGYANWSGTAASKSAAAAPLAGPRVAAFDLAPRLGGRAAEGGELRDGFAQIISAVRPSVVSISRPASNRPSAPTTGTRFVAPYAQGNVRVGSGVIIDPRGYVLTSLQVAGRENDLLVTLYHPREVVLRARRVGEDPRSDLVLLRVLSDAALPAITLGDSDRVEIGDLVLALGSPFGFADTVTSGIVSSNHRRLSIEGREFEDLIQTDARLNPGNAGGPIVNIDGQVIGISIGTLSLNSTFVGIGFAISSNRARELLRAALGA
jgi:serine protease Do